MFLGSLRETLHLHCKLFGFVLALKSLFVPSLHDSILLLQSSLELCFPFQIPLYVFLTHTLSFPSHLLERLKFLVRALFFLFSGPSFGLSLLLSSSVGILFPLGKRFFCISFFLLEKVTKAVGKHGLA